jgi:hypothetical protein
MDEEMRKMLEENLELAKENNKTSIKEYPTHNSFTSVKTISRNGKI